MDSAKFLIEYDVLEKAAECFRTLAHPHRLRIIEILLTTEESVGELAKACDIPSHIASEHLRLLKDRGYLASERKGRNVYYRIAEPALTGIIDCIKGRFGKKDGGA